MTGCCGFYFILANLFLSLICIYIIEINILFLHIKNFLKNKKALFLDKSLYVFHSLNTGLGTSMVSKVPV